MGAIGDGAERWPDGLYLDFRLTSAGKTKDCNMTKVKTLGEVARLWEDDKRHYVKYSTISAYRLILQIHILPAFGNMSDISEKDIRQFTLDKLDSGLSRKSVTDILVVLKMIMRFGKKTGIWKYREWDIRLPAAGERHKIDVLDTADYLRILDYLRSDISRANIGIYICLTTGIRIGEVCALKWSDIDLKGGVIRIRQTIERIYILDNGIGRTELVIGPPKTQNSIRDIPIVSELKTLLEGCPKPNDTDSYILTGSLRPTEPRTYRNYYSRMLERLGIPHIKFHSLRHSFATMCIKSGCDYKAVSSILGHSDIRTTLNLYVHPGLEQKRQCIDMMFNSVTGRR